MTVRCDFFLFAIKVQFEFYRFISHESKAKNAIIAQDINMFKPKP